MADRKMPKFLDALKLAIAQSLEEAPPEMGKKEIAGVAQRFQICIQAEESRKG